MALLVCGSVYPATEVGFTRLLTEANARAGEGYRLISVVAIDSGRSIASVYQLAAAPPPKKQVEAPGAFFEEPQI